MKRSLKFPLIFANTGKQNSVDALWLEYSYAVNTFLNHLFEKKELSESYIKLFGSKLSYRYKQCAKRQAVNIFKVWNKSKNKGEKPILKSSMTLDRRFIKLQKSKNSFNYWLNIASLNKRKRIYIPIKSYKYANKYFKKWNLIKGAKLIKRDNYWQIIFVFDKETPVLKKLGKEIGIDVGIKKLLVDSNNKRYGLNIEPLLNKILRKQQGSKAFKRALLERDYYINKTLKELPFKKCKTIVLENIKNIKQNTKKEKRLNKKFRKKIQRWTYAKILSRAQQLAEVAGVQYCLVNPAYTSQTCPKCKFVHKLNRKGEIFVCRNCGYKSDSDYVGSTNILKSYLAQQVMVAGSMKGSKCL